MPFSSIARTAPAVPSGRSVIERPPLSVNVYICFSTTSVVSPTERSNSSVCSNTGVRISEKPLSSASPAITSSTSAHFSDSPGMMSLVPFGAFVISSICFPFPRTAARHGFYCILIGSAFDMSRPGAKCRTPRDKPACRAAARRLPAAGPPSGFRRGCPAAPQCRTAPPCGACFGAPANKKSLICPADKGRIAFVVPPFFRKRADFAPFPFNLLNAENALSCGSRVSFPARCTRGFQPGPRSLSVPHTQVLFPVIAGYLLYCTAFSCSCQPFTA